MVVDNKVPNLTLWDPGPKGDRGGKWFLGVLALLAVAVPLLNQAVPSSSALHLSAFGITLIGKYLCYGMLALAIDLIWGYCGILSLGHAAFFSLGGYAMGMYLMRQIGRRGVYGDPILPDFMVFLNYKSLPWFWHGFNHFPFALLMMVSFRACWHSCLDGLHLGRASRACTFRSSPRRLLTP